MICEQLPGSTPDLAAALEAACLPTGDLDEEGRSFYRFLKGHAVVGFGGYETHGEDGLLRSIVVLPEARGIGIGSAITASLMDRMAAEGIRTAYLLTTSAAAFFEALGFRHLDRVGAPGAILATRQAAALCPSSAVLLSRPISGMEAPTSAARRAS